MKEFVAKVEALLKEAETEAEQWLLAREELPFPKFSHDDLPESIWQSGISEGKELGKVAALRQILSELK